MKSMLPFAKAHAYGNDFLYVRAEEVAGAPLDALAREMCDRHSGVGADGLIIYETTMGGASMRLFNADGSRAEVSGNGVRGLAALLLQDIPSPRAELSIETESGTKQLTRLRGSGSHQVFRAAMGLPSQLRQLVVTVPGESVRAVALNMGNPQCVVLGELPDEERFQIGRAHV